MNKEQLLTFIENTKTAFVSRLDEITENVCCLQEEQKETIDYSTWIGKPVFVLDRKDNKPISFYFKKFIPGEEYPFVVSAIRDIEKDYCQGSYRYCRLIRDFEDLQKGEW